MMVVSSMGLPFDRNKLCSYVGHGSVQEGLPVFIGIIIESRLQYFCCLHISLQYDNRTAEIATHPDR